MSTLDNLRKNAKRWLKALRDGTPPGKLSGVADAELMKRVTRDADYTKWTKDFLGG